MNLKQSLKTITLKNIRYPGTNLTYEQVLKSETKRLKKIIQQHIDYYYMSYSPKVYNRTHGLQNSLTVDDLCEMSASKNKIICKIIINDNAIHPSLFGGEAGNVFWLINSGWEVKKDVCFRDIYRLGYFEGYHFLENAIEEFESTSKYKITVEVIKPY